MCLVFVYGTLKDGYCNHRLLKDCSYVPAIAMKVDLYAGHDYPFAKKGDGIVFGELYEVDDNIIKKIDMLEGHPNYYRRELIDVFDDKYNLKQAWIYLYPDADKYPLIPTGEF